MTLEAKQWALEAHIIRVNFRSNLEFGKKNRRNPHNEKVFSTANNASMIKELDAPDELPSKPILGTHNNSLKDFEKSKITKVDDDFVNKIYNDAESLRSV